jgi:hypothetical protein
MGGSQSKKEKKIAVQNSVSHQQEEALKNFNMRVNSYSYPHHGPYVQYIEWCRAQYQIECMSQSSTQGDTWTGIGSNGSTISNNTWSDYT